MVTDTKIQIAERAFNMAIKDGIPVDITIPEVMKLVDDGVSTLCDKIAETRQFWRLHAITTPTVTAGVGSLDPAIMIESIKDTNGGMVLFTRTDPNVVQPAQPIIYTAYEDTLYRVKPGGDEFVYFTLRGGNGGAGQILVYSAAGQPCTGNLTVRAAQYYSLAALPDKLTNNLVTLIKDLIMDRMLGRQGMEGTNRTLADSAQGQGNMEDIP